jgi:hypothetical protein
MVFLLLVVVWRWMLGIVVELCALLFEFFLRLLLLRFCLFEVLVDGGCCDCRGRGVELDRRGVLMSVHASACWARASDVASDAVVIRRAWVAAVMCTSASLRWRIVP